MCHLCVFHSRNIFVNLIHLSRNGLLLRIITCSCSYRIRIKIHKANVIYKKPINSIHRLSTADKNHIECQHFLNSYRIFQCHSNAAIRIEAIFSFDIITYVLCVCILIDFFKQLHKSFAKKKISLYFVLCIFLCDEYN